MQRQVCRANSFSNIYLYNIYLVTNLHACLVQNNQKELQKHDFVNQLHHVTASQTSMRFARSLKGVVRLEVCHNLWPHPHFAIILALTSAAACVVVPLFRCFVFWAVKGRVSEYVLHEPCPSEGIGERQVALGRVIVELPCELVGEGPVVELHHLGVQLLHPADLDEEAGVVARRLLPDAPLHAVPEPAVAVLHPERVDGAEVLHGDELDL
uniref:Uncharacterized protein n=1 Tax=Avena sativa TaxID=4498 RepID=A0ACD6A544_AVESA